MIEEISQSKADIAIDYMLKPGDAIVSFKRQLPSARKEMPKTKDIKELKPKSKKTTAIISKELIKKYRLQIADESKNFNNPIVDYILPLSEKFKS